MHGSNAKLVLLINVNEICVPCGWSSDRTYGLAGGTTSWMVCTTFVAQLLVLLINFSPIQSQNLSHPKCCQKFQGQTSCFSPRFQLLAVALALGGGRAAGRAARLLPPMRPPERAASAASIGSRANSKAMVQAAAARIPQAWLGLDDGYGWGCS